MKEETKDYHIKLLKRFCRAHPGFFTSDKLEFFPKTHEKKILRTHVQTNVNYRGYEDNVCNSSMSDDDCCRDWLITVMNNKSFQKHFNTVAYDSIEELEVKLAVMGF